MSLMTNLIPLAASAIPVTLAVVAVMLYRKWDARSGLRSPIENRRIHGAGEQLRKRIHEQTVEIVRFLLTLFLIGPYLFAGWALQKVDWDRASFGASESLYVIGAVAISAWAIRRLIAHGAERRQAIAGLRAELFTAQELNRLLARGCSVVHDVPGDGFNIDHVVISPHAVYAVETKSVRKPRGGKQDEQFKVNYDGESLRFPHFVTRAPVTQAKNQAQWLARYLRDTLQRPIYVTPSVALPGWWIDSARPVRDCAVPVFNPSGRGAEFMTDPRKTPELDAATIGLITRALAMRYPPEV